MNDDSLEQEIAKAQARNRELAAHRDKLRAKFESDQRRAARLSHVYEQQRSLEREIAALEGRPYRDEDEPGEGYPGPPDE